MNLNKLGSVFLMALIMICGCGSKAEEQPILTVTETLAQKYDLISNRLVGDFLTGGWVISKAPDGTPDKLGDSLLWTGLAIGSLDCEKAQAILPAFENVLDATGGFLARIWPLPSEYADNQISIDGEVGALWGFARYIQKCGDQRAKDLWTRHSAAVLGSDNSIYPGSGKKLVEGLDYPWRIMAFNFGQTFEPSYSKRAIFHSQMVSWAAACAQSRSSCYRIHLALLSILTAEILDRPVTGRTRDNFCSVTKNTDIPLVDWYCGRKPADQWLSDFQLNRWEYRHQRCGTWEEPDLDEGAQSPALDWLILYDVASSSTRKTAPDDDRLDL